MAKVVATKKDETGRIYAFKLDDGRVMDYTQCMNAIDNGELPDLMYIPTQTGSMSIRSMPDGDPTNNLSAMPDFSL